MNHLLRNKEIFDRLKAEIRDAIKTEEDLVIKNLIELPYMNACIEEGLRAFPPVPIGLLRTVPKGGSDIDGHRVPEGVSPFFDVRAPQVATYADYSCRRPFVSVPGLHPTVPPTSSTQIRSFQNVG